MTDDRQRTTPISPDDVAPALDEGPPRAAAQPSRKHRGVTGGRIAAAGIGIAAMVGLVANMEVASSKAPAEKAPDIGPVPTLDALRAEKAVFQGPATQPRRIADAGKVRPIVLTPHAVVHTVGGGGGGSSGGSSPSYSSGYSAPAAAAAPVASTSGSR